jgi:hypothetical protein
LNIIITKMSLQLLQSTVPQTSQSIRCHDAIVRGNLTVPNGSATFKQLGIAGEGSITLPAEISVGTMPSAPYEQATDRTTTVTSQNEYVFMINTNSTSLAAHTSATFFVHNTRVTVNSHILLTQQSNAPGLVYNIAEIDAGGFRVQVSNVSASAITDASRIGIRIFSSAVTA